VGGEKTPLSRMMMLLAVAAATAFFDEPLVEKSSTNYFQWLVCFSR